MLLLQLLLLLLQLLLAMLLVQHPLVMVTLMQTASVIFRWPQPRAGSYQMQSLLWLPLQHQALLQPLPCRHTQQQL
jgi:hypothetical protein